MDVQSAIATLKDRAKVNDRNLVNFAAEFLVAHRDELTRRAVVFLLPQELTAPEWANIIANSSSPCECGNPQCEAKAIRIIGPALRKVLEDGATVVVQPSESVFVREIGAQQPAAAISVSGEGEQRVLIFERFGDSGGASPIPFALAAQSLVPAPVEQRTVFGIGSDGFGTPMYRVDAVDQEAGTATIVIDKQAEIWTLPAFEEGETVVIHADEKVFLRKIGTPDDACLRVYWLDAIDADQFNAHTVSAAANSNKPPAAETTGDTAATAKATPTADDAPASETAVAADGAKDPIWTVMFHDRPLDQGLAFAAMLGQAQPVIRGFALRGLAKLLDRPVEKRLMNISDDNGVPMPFVRLDGVDQEAHTITLRLDRNIERFQPAEPAESEEAGPLGAFILGPNGPQPLTPDALAAILSGAAGAPTDDEGDTGDGPGILMPPIDRSKLN